MKKVFKGWIRNDENPKELFVWKEMGGYRELELNIAPCDKRGAQVDWPMMEWPPLKVKITVEVGE